MSPPIRDGSGSSIGSIRLGDGSEISEVRTGAGDVLFSEIPDSEDLYAHYDSTQLTLSDGDTVSSWGDETNNNHDLFTSTSPTYASSVIGGNPVVDFDKGDELDTSWSTISQPNHIFVVAEFQTTGALYDSNGGDQHLFRDNAGTWNMFSGSNLDDGSSDRNPHIFSCEWNGSASVMRIDGVQVASGNPGTQSLPGFRLTKDEGGSSQASAFIGEILLYPTSKSSIVSDVENYLNNKWSVY